MKIQDAKKAYAAQMDTLWTRKRDLSQALKKLPAGRRAQCGSCGDLP